MRDTSEMTILDCIQEMRQRGHTTEADHWYTVSCNANSWNDHAACVDNAREALDSIRSTDTPSVPFGEHDWTGPWQAEEARAASYLTFVHNEQQRLRDIAQTTKPQTTPIRP